MPSAYLRSLEKNHDVGPDRLDAILRAHLIEPDLIRSDDFDNFVRARTRRLLDLIEDATEKAISGRDSDEVMESFGGSLSRG